MALEIVREHAQRPGRTANLPERIAQLLELYGIWPGKIAGVVERTLRAHQRTARAYQREVKIGEGLAQAVADLL